MKVFVNLVVIGALIGIAIVVYRIPYSPCDTSLTYTIGSVDPRFGLSADAVAADAKEAARLWNQAEGMQLLSPVSSSGDLTINFVYDQRSDLQKNVTDLQEQVSQDNRSLQQQIDGYKADSTAFEQKLADLNATIQKYNSQGGAPPDVYQNLVKEQNQLRAEGNALNARARQLNLNARDYNSEVQNLNQNVVEFDQAISQTPEEGLYDGTDRTITIYFANDQHELIHTLAHEFGHALGMDHVQNAAAIMYPYSTTELAVTPDDKEQLDTVCRDIPLPIYWLEQLRDKTAILLIHMAKN